MPPSEWEKHLLLTHGILGLLAAFLSGVFFTLGILVAPLPQQKALLIAIAVPIGYLAWAILKDLVNLAIQRPN